ncbi:DUF3040 domain-containing protein [Streptomyces sp. NPDC058001]|uniref:DUF3040 domain-containing protein n=1 Tax=Streptomyces sp. NPDC058001 TaxID=3346300 RepID=UPI0036E664A3
MSAPDDERLAGLEDHFRRDDPRFARAMGAGRPCSPREYRRRPAQLALTAAITCLALSFVLAEPLLLAAGLILSGVAATLRGPGSRRRRRPGPRIP